MDLENEIKLDISADVLSRFYSEVNDGRLESHVEKTFNKYADDGGELYSLSNLLSFGFNPANNLHYLASLFRLISESNPDMPDVSMSTYESELCDFNEGPINYFFQGLNNISVIASNYFQFMDDLSINERFPEDALKAGILMHNMIRYEIAQQRGQRPTLGWDDMPEATFIKKNPSVKKLEETNPAYTLILAFAQKSLYPEKVSNLGVRLYKTISWMPDKPKIPGNKERKLLVPFYDHPFEFTVSKLSSLYKKYPELHNLICGEALLKEANGKTSEEMIELYFNDNNRFYEIMDKSKAMEDTFIYLEKECDNLFRLCMQNIHNAMGEPEEPCLEDSAEGIVLFNEGVDIDEIKADKRNKQLFQVALKYPEHFPNIIPFMKKYKPMSDLYDLDEAFKGREYLYKVYGKIEPIPEVLMLGATIYSLCKVV